MKVRYWILLSAVLAVILMAGPVFAQPTDNSWEVMDGLLLCPPGAGAGDTVTGYIVFGGVIQTRADFEAVDYTVAWLYINGDEGPSIYDALDVAMAEDGGISVDLPGDFSPDTSLACGAANDDGWPAGVEMDEAVAPSADVATALADGYFGDVGGASCAGGGEGGYPICVELGRDGDDVTMTWRDADGAIAGDYEAVELYIAGPGMVEITPGDPGSATFPWDDALETSDFAQLVLQDDGGEDTESRIYFAVPYEVLPDRIDMGYDTPAEAIDAGGNCEAVEPPAPEVSARITGPHNVDVGADVTLTVVTDGIDSPTYLWGDASTAATLALGVVDAGDTGVYTCTVNGEADGEAIDPIEASFTLWVGVATPLAGGLGLGLLAGACALAGAVSIRKKK